MLSIRHSVTALVALALATGAPAAAQKSFVEFESGPVRPLAMSPDGTTLFVVNTPDNQLEVFSIGNTGLTRLSSVSVGMEPVAVAARSDTEVWVVNHLSDSVSIVDVSGSTTPRVVKTLLVGDEPRDIVFAGPGNARAFITTAHRGQHRSHASIAGVPGAGDPQLTTAGLGRADVWVFDAALPGSDLGGLPIEIVTLFGDTPRALAASADGSTVYAAVFQSGNQTAVVSEGVVCDGFAGAGACAGDGVTSPGGLGGGQLPGGNPGPSTDVAGAPAPDAGLVVQYDNAAGEWRDELGRNWSNGIRFHLPDQDVFAINATTLSTTSSFAHVGTILFNIAVNPVNGNLYVSNSEAPNLTRFEGPGVFGGSTVQGHLSEARISVITGGAVKPRHVNPHIDYNVRPAPAGVRDHSLATLLQMVISGDGATLYTAAFGSSKVGVFSTADLENDALWDGSPPDYDPNTASANYITVSGGGPSGLALDESRGRLYVTTRFNNSVAVVDLSSGTEITSVPLHNPEPASVVDGRHMLYDAFKTSSNGETSCASCHIFADFDSLAWDLGNPDAGVSTSPLPIRLEIGGVLFSPPINGSGNPKDFHPMKGPMTTQTLRGLVNHGAMHWRGDRSNGFFGIDNSPNFDDADLSFRNFIVAMEGLVGSEKPPTDPGLQADMQLFADFALEIMLPPNPVRSLDNSLTANQTAGQQFYLGNVGPESIPGTGIHFSDGVPFPNLGFSCEGCHTLNPAQGHFGGNGFQSFENENQIIKIPQLRNLYQKVGMFGMPDFPFNNPGDNSHQGDQVRGVGFLHDGSTDSLFRFFNALVFNPSGNIGFTGGDAQRRDVEEFILAFDTDLAPIVGQQVTLVGSGNADVLARIALLEARAGTSFVLLLMGGITTECDLVVKGRVAGEARGYLWDPGTSTFGSDRASEGVLSSSALKTLALTAGQELTYTCAPPGSGLRMALDRDEDGALDRDEFDAGTDPANAGSVAGACSDGLDNDGDGQIDLADPGCVAGSSNIENPQCNDGFDNDGDGQIDLADPNCATAWDDRELRTNRRCGMGAELALLLPMLLALAGRRRRFLVT